MTHVMCTVLQKSTYHMLHFDIKNSPCFLAVSASLADLPSPVNLLAPVRLFAIDHLLRDVLTSRFEEEEIQPLFPPDAARPLLNNAAVEAFLSPIPLVLVLAVAVRILSEDFLHIPLVTCPRST